MANESLDPRYDPMFQRGYQGAPPGSAAARPPRPVHQSARPVPPAADAQRRESNPGQVPESPGLEPLGPAPSASPQSRPVVTTEIFGEGAGPVRRLRIPNPFIILLWLIGPGLIVVGINSTLLAFSERTFGPITSSEEMALQQLAWTLSPSAVTVGLGIIAGLVFWHAAGWRRARQ